MSSRSEYVARPRASELGLKIGILTPGPFNSITDVPGVTVGHTTLIHGDPHNLTNDERIIRTGVTMIQPHTGNMFRQKVTGAVHVINGYGKSVGLPQIEELGLIETPIGLTNTLNTWTVADALVDYVSKANPGIYSFNPTVGECNDSFLNDILGRHVSSDHVLEAINSAVSPNILEGNVGAGTGMTGFGWKGGIGTASRVCDGPHGANMVGVLTLTNTGDSRELRIGGQDVGSHFVPPGISEDTGGSIIIVVGTNAAVTSRQLTRIARRAALGLGRMGAIASHSSGDFVIAFSNSDDRPAIDDIHLNPLFRGTVEATEEAIINSLLRAETMIGRDGNKRHSIPIDDLIAIL